MRLRSALIVCLPFVFSGFASADEPYGGISIAPGRPMAPVGATEGASPAKDAAQARAIGAKWLERNQGADGGWAAGGWGGAQAGSDVATTVIAVQALRRDDPVGHQAAIRKGIEFVVKAVETAPKAGPLLNTPTNTQPQYKLGPNVDTHLAAKLLGDVAGEYSGAEKARILGALDVALVKVQSAQAANGAYETTGWAPALSSSFATQGLAKGKELGRAVVEEKSIALNDDWQRKQLQGQSFDASAGAGVELYAVATGLANATAAKSRGGGGMAPVADAAAERVSRGDAGFVAGYGSLGGEEVLSYGMIGDSLRATDPQKSKDWDLKMGDYLVRVQNGDGSWSGHHCITSTPFTTAAAVMTLGAERKSGGPSAMKGNEKPVSADSWWATVE